MEQNAVCHGCCRAERDGGWKTWTFQQYYGEVAAAAKSLIRLGLERFHGVCILGFNAPEWFIGYLGGIMVSCYYHTIHLPYCIVDVIVPTV